MDEFRFWTAAWDAADQAAVQIYPKSELHSRQRQTFYEPSESVKPAAKIQQERMNVKPDISQQVPSKSVTIGIPHS